MGLWRLEEAPGIIRRRPAGAEVSEDSGIWVREVFFCSKHNEKFRLQRAKRENEERRSAGGLPEQWRPEGGDGITWQPADSHVHLDRLGKGFRRGSEGRKNKERGEKWPWWERWRPRPLNGARRIKEILTILS